MANKLTADPDFPAEAARLIQIFSETAGPFEPDHVLMAALNFAAWVISSEARYKQLNRDQSIKAAINYGNWIVGEVAKNFDRKPQASDVTIIADVNAKKSAQ